MDDVDKLTARARASADGILAQAYQEVDDVPDEIPLGVVRDLIAAGFGVGKQEGLAESRAVIEELQGLVERLAALMGRALRPDDEI